MVLEVERVRTLGERNNSIGFEFDAALGQRVSTEPSFPSDELSPERRFLTTSVP